MVRRVFGEPIERDGVLMVPVACARGGFGGGAGEGQPDPAQAPLRSACSLDEHAQSSCSRTALAPWMASSRMGRPRAQIRSTSIPSQSSGICAVRLAQAAGSSGPSTRPVKPYKQLVRNPPTFAISGPALGRLVMCRLTATAKIYSLSLHDAPPLYRRIPR